MISYKQSWDDSLMFTAEHGALFQKTQKKDGLLIISKQIGIYWQNIPMWNTA